MTTESTEEECGLQKSKKHQLKVLENSITILEKEKYGSL